MSDQRGKLRTRGTKRATIQDVADLAGVSRGTASRVVNHSPNVSERARKAVEKAIQESNYQANPHARSLASGRSNAIAVLLTQPQSDLFEDPTFSVMLQGISAGLSGSDQALVLLLAGNDEERRRAATFLDLRHVDGVVHISPHAEDKMLDSLLASDVPVVVCGHPPPGVQDSRLRSVSVDDEAGAVQAVRHLKARGAKKIAMVAGPESATGSVKRVEGYRLVVGDDYAPGLVAHGGWGPESGRAAFEKIIQAHPDIDAVFCASDRLAAGVYAAARDEGLRIPDDLRVVGFDGHAIGLELSPQLTTIRQPIKLLGRTAIQMLTEWSKGQDPGHRIFPVELVVRESS